MKRLRNFDERTVSKSNPFCFLPTTNARKNKHESFPTESKWLDPPCYTRNIILNRLLVRRLQGRRHVRGLVVDAETNNSSFHVYLASQELVEHGLVKLDLDVVSNSVTWNDKTRGLGGVLDIASHAWCHEAFACSTTPYDFFFGDMCGGFHKMKSDLATSLARMNPAGGVWGFSFLDRRQHDRYDKKKFLTHYAYVIDFCTREAADHGFSMTMSYSSRCAAVQTLLFVVTPSDFPTLTVCCSTLGGGIADHAEDILSFCKLRCIVEFVC